MISNAAPIVRDLIEKKAKAKENEKGWKAEDVRITGELAKIIDPEEMIKKAEKNQTGGSTTAELHGGKFTVEAEKKVKWDSGKLQRIASKLTWPQVEAMFKITFEMSEKKYQNLVDNVQAGLVDKTLLDVINEARTVEIGEAKIKSAELLNQ